MFPLPLEMDMLCAISSIGNSACWLVNSFIASRSSVEDQHGTQGVSGEDMQVRNAH